MKIEFPEKKAKVGLLVAVQSQNGTQKITILIKTHGPKVIFFRGKRKIEYFQK